MKECQILLCWVIAVVQGGTYTHPCLTDLAFNTSICKELRDRVDLGNLSGKSSFGISVLDPAIDLDTDRTFQEVSNFIVSLPSGASSLLAGVPSSLAEVPRRVLESYTGFARGVRRGLDDIVDKITSGGARFTNDVYGGIISNKESGTFNEVSDDPSSPYSINYIGLKKNKFKKHAPGKQRFNPTYEKFNFKLNGSKGYSFLSTPAYTNHVSWKRKDTDQGDLQDVAEEKLFEDNLVEINPSSEVHALLNTKYGSALPRQEDWTVPKKEHFGPSPSTSSIKKDWSPLTNVGLGAGPSSPYGTKDWTLPTRGVESDSSSLPTNKGYGSDPASPSGKKDWNLPTIGEYGEGSSRPSGQNDWKGYRSGDPSRGIVAPEYDQGHPFESARIPYGSSRHVKTKTNQRSTNKIYSFKDFNRNRMDNSQPQATRKKNIASNWVYHGKQNSMVAKHPHLPTSQGKRRFDMFVVNSAERRDEPGDYYEYIDNSLEYADPPTRKDKFRPSTFDIKKEEFWRRNYMLGIGG